LSDCVPGAAIFRVRQVRYSCKGSARGWLISETFLPNNGGSCSTGRLDLKLALTTEAGNAAEGDRVETRGDVYYVYTAYLSSGAVLFTP
jgi:hypothetical protein